MAHRASRQHVHVVVLAQVEIPQGVPYKRARHLDLLDAAAVIEAQLLQEIGAHQFKTEALPHHF